VVLHGAKNLGLPGCGIKGEVLVEYLHHGLRHQNMKTTLYCSHGDPEMGVIRGEHNHAVAGTHCVHGVLSCPRVKLYLGILWPGLYTCIHSLIHAYLFVHAGTSKRDAATVSIS